MFSAGFELTAACGTPSRRRRAGPRRSDSLIYAYRNQGHLIAQSTLWATILRAIPRWSWRPSTSRRRTWTRSSTPATWAVLSGRPWRGHRAPENETYCSSIGVEYLHIQDMEVRRWLQAEMEPVRNKPASLRRERVMEILEHLVDAEVFEKFIQSRYRAEALSLEGAEAFMHAFHARAGARGARPRHRGDRRGHGPPWPGSTCSPTSSTGPTL